MQNKTLTFRTDMLNTCWIEDIYAILIALKNGTMRISQAKERLAKKHKMFKEAGNFSDMDDVTLWEYVMKYKELIMNYYEKLAV